MERQRPRRGCTAKQVAKEAKAGRRGTGTQEATEVQANGHEPDRTETTKPQPRLPFKPYREVRHRFHQTLAVPRPLWRKRDGRSPRRTGIRPKSVLTQDLHMHVAANAGDTRWPCRPHDTW